MNVDKVEPQKSPSLRLRVAEHKMELEDKEFDTVWTSCCLTIDKRATIYFTQYTIIVLVMLFCGYQLLTLKSCENQQAYLGLLTMLIGLISYRNREYLTAVNTIKMIFFQAENCAQIGSYSNRQELWLPRRQ